MAPAARVTVHFTEIEEKFAPHDTVFSFTTPQELSDNALSAANSLHTAAPSTSASSTSSKKLDGIHEDAEDIKGTSGTAEGAALERTETVTSAANVEVAPDTASMSSRPFSPAGNDDKRPKTPGTVGGDTMTDSAIASPKGYAQSVRSFKSLNHYDQPHYDDPNRRSSTQTARADLDFSYLYKPKVKLGPRPTQDPHPPTKESKSAKLPASLKSAVRSKGSSSRPKSRDTSTVPSIGIPPPPPVPTITEMPANTPSRPTSSPGLKSGANSIKSPGITPEKQRLQRAIELRKKQKAAQLAKQKRSSGRAEQSNATAGAELKVEQAEEKALVATGTDGEDNSSHRETTSSTESGSTLKPDEAPGTPDHTKADSGVQLMISGAGDEEDARPSTPVASSPISVQESSNPSSTRPSSISDGGERKEVLDAENRIDAAPHDGATEASLGLPSAAISAPTRTSGAEHPNRDVSSSPDRGATGEHQTAAAKGPELSEDITTALPSSSSLPERRSTTKSKRRVPVDPIRVDADAESSDDDCDYLSDDSLMEELQSATVEEAKPMSVSKSPIMPIFPRRKSQGSTLSARSAEHRVNSNPLSMYRTDDTPTRLSPSPESHVGLGQRSLSASYASEAQRAASLAKKSNVSSGISQRIKALAEKSSKEAAAVPAPKVGYTPDPKHRSIAQRSNSFRVSHADDNKHLKRLSKSSFINVPPLERPASRSENSSESIQTVYNKNANNKTESVTVTARIVRAPQTPNHELETSPLDLQPSPITIDRNSANDAPAPPSIVIPSAAEEPTFSPKSGDASPSQHSNANLESPAQALPRTSSESSWRAFGRRRSEAMSPPPPMSRSQSVTSLDSTATEEGDEKKKGNRASRLLKRMSNSLSTSKKSLNQMMSSAVQEEPMEPIQTIEEKKESQPGVEIGDLNVQFPDTLVSLMVLPVDATFTDEIIALEEEMGRDRCSGQHRLVPLQVE